MPRGYTLMELMVVLIIMVSLFALVAPNFSTASTSNELRAASRQMVAALREARSHAVTTRNITAFTLDLEQGTFQVDGRRTVQLPSQLELTLVTGQSELRGKGRATIRFYADGSSTGGLITLASEGRVLQLEVAWLTGRITAREVLAADKQEMS